MADTNKPARRSVASQMNPEARAFGIITAALEELPTEVVHRVLDHAAKMYGFYVVHELPEASLEIGARVGNDPGLPIERHFDPAPVE